MDWSDQKQEQEQGPGFRHMAVDRSIDQWIHLRLLLVRAPDAPRRRRAAVPVVWCGCMGGYAGQGMTGQGILGGAGRRGGRHHMTHISRTTHPDDAIFASAAMGMSSSESELMVLGLLLLLLPVGVGWAYGWKMMLTALDPPAERWSEATTTHAHDQGVRPIDPRAGAGITSNPPRRMGSLIG